MNTVIYRTVITTMCSGQQINDHGEFVDFYDEINRDVGIETANRVLRRRYGDESIVINRIEKKTAKYRMPISEFVRWADKIEEEVQ